MIEGADVSPFLIARVIDCGFCSEDHRQWVTLDDVLDDSPNGRYRRVGDVLPLIEYTVKVGDCFSYYWLHEPFGLDGFRINGGPLIACLRDRNEQGATAV